MSISVHLKTLQPMHRLHSCEDRNWRRTRKVDELQAAVCRGAVEVRYAIHHDGQHAVSGEQR
jgi:hypothetical protein